MQLVSNNGKDTMELFDGTAHGHGVLRQNVQVFPVYCSYRSAALEEPSEPDGSSL